MVDTIIPEIRKSMPFVPNFKIQQDNARPHIGQCFANLRMLQESPLSINHVKKTELETLFLSIQEAYRNIDAPTLDKVWKTKCRVIHKIIDAGGEAIEISH